MTDEELQTLVEDRQGAVAIREELQKQIDDATDQIKQELLNVRGVRKAPVGEWTPQIVVQARQTLNKAKLLSAGVSVAQIEAATETSEIVTLRVNKRKETD